MIFAKKASIPHHAFCISQAMSFLHHLGKKSIKNTLVLQRLSIISSQVSTCLFFFLHFSFPAQQQMPVTVKSPVRPPQQQPGAGTEHPSPRRGRASQCSQSTAASIPAIPIDHMGKYKSRFSGE